MRIDFEFSGGYGGLFAARPLSYRADTDDMPAARRQRLLELVTSSGVLELEETASGAPAGPQRDTFTYRLVLRDGGITRRFAFDDVSAPVALRPLLEFLRDLAIKERQGSG